MGIPYFSRVRDMCDIMRARKAETFPTGSMVSVQCDRFHGVGIVSYDEGCPLDQLAVRVESQNVWWYPIDTCEPYHGLTPSWIRSYFRQHGMKQTDVLAQREGVK